MRNPFVCAVGGVISADIAVPEHEREVAFYSSVLGTGSTPLWQTDLLNNLGNPVIGLGEKVPAYEALPLQWMPHFQVADVAASVAAAVEMGGSETMHGKDDNGQSLWAACTDPDGAGFGLIPVVPASEETSAAEPLSFGSISWLSLAVNDPETTQAFYQKVIGWEPRVNDAEEGSKGYQMLVEGGSVAAEISSTGDAMEVPPVWVIYVPVGDLQESLQRVEAGGGHVIKQGEESKSAIIADPIGGYFGLQQSE